MSDIGQVKKYDIIISNSMDQWNVSYDHLKWNAEMATSTSWR